MAIVDTPLPSDPTRPIPAIGPIVPPDDPSAPDVTREPNIDPPPTEPPVELPPEGPTGDPAPPMAMHLQK